MPRIVRQPAVFFDRDGTLIWDEGYTYRPDMLRWQPGAIESIRRVNEAGALAVIVTNQSGVARGLFSVDDVDRFHQEMSTQLRERNARIDAYYYCPYHENGIIDEYKAVNHPDRKPNSGMLRRAIWELPIDPDRSLLVGDAPSDVAAAHSIGLRATLVRPGELLAAVETWLTDCPPPQPRDLSTELIRRAERARGWLFEHALPRWCGKGLDMTLGCFHEQMLQSGVPAPLPRRIRVQARQTAVFALSGRLGWSGRWPDAVSLGVNTLRRKGIRSDGGTLHQLGTDGLPSDNRRDLYDLAFVVFALANAHLSLPEMNAAGSAESLLDWLDKNWAHPGGGFYEGEVAPAPPRRQNPHMHLFEALLSLVEATQNATHVERAHRLLTIILLECFDSRTGAINEEFRSERGIGDVMVEPGHQFEWSWLIHRFVEVARATHLDGQDLPQIAERLRVFGELYGVDPQTGRVYDSVRADGSLVGAGSRLWPHAERLKANLIRYEFTGDQLAGTAAVQSFDTLMEFCDVPQTGLWRDRRDPQGRFLDEPAPASSLYHIAFAFAELIRVAAAIRGERVATR